MGLDIGALWGQAEDAAKTGMNDLLKQGGNAGLGYLEDQAIKTIEADKAQHVKDYQQAVADKLNQPATPNSFSSFLTGITQGPIIQQYGTYIIAGVGLVLVAGFMLRGK